MLKAPDDPVLLTLKNILQKMPIERVRIISVSGFKMVAGGQQTVALFRQQTAAAGWAFRRKNTPY